MMQAQMGYTKVNGRRKIAGGVLRVNYFYHISA